MKKLLYSASALLLTSCATQMATPELVECLQPNRRVVVEVNGRVVKPPAKPPAGSEAKPEAKPAKPELVPFEETTYVQGNSAFDPGSAVLKDEGKKELDNLVGVLKKRAVQIGAVIVSGHTDRFEAQPETLSEARAKAVTEYLTSRGVDGKLIFWEGKGAKDPVPVTNFCS